MSKRSNTARAENQEAPENPGQDPEAPDVEQSAPPVRMNADTLSCVKSCASTITKCSEAEVANYISTMEFVCRQLCIQYADRWKEICKMAKDSTAGDTSQTAKAQLSVKIDLDHTNIQIMSTKLTAGVKPNSIKKTVSTEEDLRQIKFVL